MPGMEMPASLTGLPEAVLICRSLTLTKLGFPEMLFASWEEAVLHAGRSLQIVEPQIPRGVPEEKRSL